MTGVSNSSPAILRKSTGAANVGRDGSTVDADLTAMETEVAALQDDVTGLQADKLDKAGGAMTGTQITFPYGGNIAAYPVAGGLARLISLTTHDGGSQSIAINADAMQGTVHTIVLDGYEYRINRNHASSFIIAGFNQLGFLLGGSGARIQYFSNDDTMGDNSSTRVPTQYAAKQYTDAQAAAAVVLANAYTDDEIGALPTPGLALLSSADATAAAAVDFVLPGGYDEYRIKFQGVYGDSVSQTLVMRSSTDGGSSFDAGALDYYSSSNGGAPAGASFISLGTLQTSAANHTNGQVRVYRPHEAQYCKFGAEVDRFVSSTSMDRTEIVATRVATADVDAIRFLATAGNITGKFSLYGVIR